jgi:hypothetical protein
MFFFFLGALLLRLTFLQIYTNQIYARGVSCVPKSVFASMGALNRRIS